MSWYMLRYTNEQNGNVYSIFRIINFLLHYLKYEQKRSALTPLASATSSVKKIKKNESVHRHNLHESVCICTQCKHLTLLFTLRNTNQCGPIRQPLLLYCCSLANFVPEENEECKLGEPKP